MAEMGLTIKATRHTVFQIGFETVGNSIRIEIVRLFDKRQLPNNSP